MHYKGMIAPRTGTVCKCCGKKWWTTYNGENFI